MIRQYFRACRHRLAVLLAVLLVALPPVIFSSCEREPPLQLVLREKDIDLETDKVILDLEVLWDYELAYNWKKEWCYGWDSRDDSIFGTWDIKEPELFNIRRYFTKDDPKAPHTSVLKDQVEGTRFRSKYLYGYYDILVFNEVNTIDGVQSLHFDEESTLEYITAYTNQSPNHTLAPQMASRASNSRQSYSFYQPEFLFAGNYDDLHVSNNPADYDYYIEETNSWFKRVPLNLTPVTYIYLTQVILHRAARKVDNVGGDGSLSGMAQSTNLYSHISSEEDISVNYQMRMKKNLTYIDPLTNVPEEVDIIGGRVLTFGLTGVNPYGVTRASTSYQRIEDSRIRNYLEVNMVFPNGRDSTYLFDVTDQVKERYKGGVITIHLDSIAIPGGKGNSMFDAIVVDPEEETHEFEM